MKTVVQNVLGTISVLAVQIPLLVTFSQLKLKSHIQKFVTSNYADVQCTAELSTRSDGVLRGVPKIAVVNARSETVRRHRTNSTGSELMRDEVPSGIRQCY